MIKIPEEEQIVEDLQEIKSMQLVVQVIMVIVCIIIASIVLYYCCKKFRHAHTLFKYCFPFLHIVRMLRTSHRTDLFVEVTIDERQYCMGTFYGNRLFSYTYSFV